MAFWDSSAIVPLSVNEKSSRLARNLWRQFAKNFVWSESVVEVSSAFARLEREGKINKPTRLKLENRLLFVEAQWVKIETTSRIIEIGRTFPALYGLKAMDCLQLAAALVWCNEYPKNRNFIAGDGKLLKAAESAGFTIYDLS